MTTATSREEWSVWGCDASVVVTAPSDAGAARSIVEFVLRDVDDACSRFRADSELTSRADDFAHGAEASPMLVRLIGAALEAARITDGDVDPTLGNELARLGYNRDISILTAGQDTETTRASVSIERRASPWRDVHLEGAVLTIPRHVQLDLGATGKAVAADLSASAVASQLGGDVLVSLGGDIATSGTEESDGWDILVQDTEADPRQQVLLSAGAAMATSSTQKRRWLSGGYLRHHILDPASGLPATPTWRSVTVAASSCLHANAMTTASIVRGFRAVEWLESLNIAARFVDLQGQVVTTRPWPAVVDQRELAGGLR